MTQPRIRLRSAPVKSPKTKEPPGFQEFWDDWSKRTKFGGRRDHYAEVFAAGLATKQVQEETT